MLRRHAVTVALQVDQGRAGDTGHELHIAVKRFRHGHEPALFVLQDIGHLQRGIVRVVELTPRQFALLGQPDIEFRPAGPTPVLGVVPNAGAPVAYVFLNDALLPTAGNIAEFRLEQVMPAHGFKAAVDLALLTRQHLVHRRLHVVVDATLRNTAKGSERTGVGIKQHLVALARIRHQPEGTTGAQLGVRQLHPPAQATDEGVLGAPVKLEGLTMRKPQGNERAFGGGQSFTGFPIPRECTHATVTSGVAQRAQRQPHLSFCASLAFVTPAVGFEPGLQGVSIVVQFGDYPAWRIFGLHHFALAQPRAYRVSGQACLPAYFFDGQFVAKVQTPYLCQGSHFDHSCCLLCITSNAQGF